MPQIETSATLALVMQKLFASDVSSTSPATVPSATTTAPSGDGVIALLNGPIGGAAPDLIKLCFTAQGSGATGVATIWLWHQVGGVGNLPAIYVPTTLAVLALTSGSNVGVALAAILNTANLVTTIVGTTLNTTANEIISPGDGSMAMFKGDPIGAPFAQVKLQAGNASNPVNAFWAGY